MIQLNSIPFTSLNLLPALVADYIQGKDAVFSLTKYPFAFSSFKNVISDKAKDNTDRKLLVEVLQSQYSAIPTSAAVTANIESLLSDTTFTVVAAHQPCLFFGPLYNIYKIAGAINLTNQLNQQFTNHHFVPVFWMGEN